jgi:CubicO group peptidase (beta-lactamase class C family)
MEEFSHRSCRLAALDTVLESNFPISSSSPGRAVGVLSRGNVLFSHYAGLADVGRLIPVTRQTVFEVASVSKQFTAAAIILLEEDGHLQLDHSITAHLQELPQHPYEAVTIRHLLTHTSGLPDYLSIMPLANRTSYSAADVLNLVATLKTLESPTGTQYRYCNTGYVFCALIVERVSKLSFATFLRERVFKPLGMTNTFVRDYPFVPAEQLAIGYAPSNASSYIECMTPLLLVGDGMVHTTIADMAIWDECLFYSSRHLPGGKSLLSSRLRERAMLSDGKLLQYALGLRHDSYRGLATVGHGGAFEGFKADYMHFPAQQLSVVVLCNSSDQTPRLAARRIADQLFIDLLAPDVQPVLLSPTCMRRFCGVFASETGDWYSVSVPVVGSSAQSVLLVTMADGRSLLVGAFSPVELRPVSGPYAVQLCYQGDDYSAIVISEGDQRSILARRRTAIGPDDELLEALAGFYCNDILQVEYHLECRPCSSSAPPSASSLNQKKLFLSGLKGLGTTSLEDWFSPRVVRIGPLQLTFSTTTDAPELEIRAGPEAGLRFMRRRCF